MASEQRTPITVGIGGLGAIGMAIARRLDAGLPGLTLAAVSARDRLAAAERLAGFAVPPPVVGLAELPGLAEVVVECAPAAVFAEVAEPTVEAGGTLMTLSCGALLQRFDLVERARETGARILVPSGALLGLDAVRAAAQGTITSVRMITRKPPRSLAGAPHLERNGIDLSNLDGPLKVFEGSAREGAVGFPANVNVAAALSLAGIGPDETRLEVWADPALDRNTHRVVVEADSARFEMAIENVPSPTNPGSGRITALSVIAALERLTAPLVVGT